MHQQPGARPSPRVASPASMPQTNPARTNNPRDAVPTGARQRAASVLSNRDMPLASPTSDSAASSAVSTEAVKKLDQIVQVRLFTATTHH